MQTGKNDFIILITGSNHLRNKLSRDNSGQKLRSNPKLRTGMSVFLPGASCACACACAWVLEVARRGSWRDFVGSTRAVALHPPVLGWECDCILCDPVNAFQERVCVSLSLQGGPIWAPEHFPSERGAHGNAAAAL